MDPQIEAWCEWLAGRTKILPRSFTYYTSEGTFVADPEIVDGSRMARLRFSGMVVGQVTHIFGVTSLARDPAKRTEFILPDVPESLLDWSGHR